MFADSQVTIGIISILGVIITASFTAYTALRVKSGKIATSEATQLWQESGNMRKELKDEILALKDEMKDLKAENTTLREDNAKWRQRLDDMEKELKDVKEDNGALRGRVYDLERAHG